MVRTKPRSRLRQQRALGHVRTGREDIFSFCARGGSCHHWRSILRLCWLILQRRKFLHKHGVSAFGQGTARVDAPYLAFLQRAAAGPAHAAFACHVQQYRGCGACPGNV